MSRLVVLASLALALAACGPTVRSQPLNPSPYPLTARPAMAVQVYTTALPEFPYIEVAALTAEGGHADEHYGALRDYAGRLGCDALVFTATPRQASSTGIVWGKGVASSSTNTGSSATCVVWRRDSGPGPQ
jgi:hypothetical protein